MKNRGFKQIKREGNVALYGHDLYGYEVVVFRIRKAHEAFGRQYPDMECYPSSAEWGSYGWTYQNRDLAGSLKRFDSLLPEWGANSTRPPQSDVLNP